MVENGAFTTQLVHKLQLDTVCQNSIVYVKVYLLIFRTKKKKKHRWRLNSTLYVACLTTRGISNGNIGWLKTYNNCSKC